MSIVRALGTEWQDSYHKSYSSAAILGRMLGEALVLADSNGA